MTDAVVLVAIAIEVAVARWLLSVGVPQPVAEVRDD